MEPLNIGVDSWIIQDGNYGDFSVGQTARFALEFYPQSLNHSSGTSKSAANLNANIYDVCAQVIYSTNEVLVLDMGFLAYRETGPSKNAPVGARVEGQIYVGIDPFFYMEGLNKLPGMPDLSYDFRVEQILLETTPLITSQDESGRTLLTRDDRQRSYREIPETDAWNDDNGHANYILRCVRIDSGV